MEVGKSHERHGPELRVVASQHVDKDRDCPPVFVLGQRQSRKVTGIAGAILNPSGQKVRRGAWLPK